MVTCFQCKQVVNATLTYHIFIFDFFFFLGPALTLSLSLTNTLPKHTGVLAKSVSPSIYVSPYLNLHPSLSFTPTSHPLRCLTCPNLCPNPNCRGGTTGNTILTGGQYYLTEEQSSTQHRNDTPLLVSSSEVEIHKHFLSA